MAQRGIGQHATTSPLIVVDVRGLRAAADDTGYRRVRERVLEHDLHPARAADVSGPIRKWPILHCLQIAAARRWMEWP
jgi:hypothetical protein